MSWRIPLFIQVVIGGILFLGATILPETPRWLLDNDYDHEGILVLARLHGSTDPNHEEAKKEFREIKESVLAERAIGQRSYSEMWRKYTKRVLIAMSSQMVSPGQRIGIFLSDFIVCST